MQARRVRDDLRTGGGCAVSGVDLGTWHVRVVLSDGRGFITRWGTGSRFYADVPWDGDTCGLNGTRHPPAWSDDEELLSTIQFMFLGGGNYSCDCNLLAFLDDVAMVPPEQRIDHRCAHDLTIATLDAIRPDGSEVRLKGIA